MTTMTPFDEAVSIVLQLSPLEKVKLVERIMSTLEDDLAPSASPAKSLYGVLAHLGPSPSEEDIDEARREMWGDFPHEDILG